MKYLKRLIDEKIKETLEGTPALQIVGPKWCGKTTTAKKYSQSFILMDEPQNRENNINLSKYSPLLLLEGATPRLIDEWQIIPSIWGTVRHEVDRRQKMGQFILTGSSVPSNSNEIFHSGAGRIATIKMRPMSLFESLDSDGSVSLKNLFKEVFEPAINSLDKSKLPFLICRGGWPTTIINEKHALKQASFYIEAIINVDMSNVDNTKRQPNYVFSIMRSYARHLSTQATLETITNDVKETTNLSYDTIGSYVNALKKLHVIDELPTWNLNIRSKVSLRTTPKRQFVDPSIATAILKISPQDLLYDIKTLGLLFESLCIRDLRVYADANNGNVYHYRDSNDLECDAIIHLDTGQWCAIEIKLASFQIEEAAKNLLKFKSKLDLNKIKAPSFLMVLTGENHSYLRDDGIYVISIASLRD